MVLFRRSALCLLAFSALAAADDSTDIKGWFFAEETWLTMLEYMNTNGVTGALAEIGVHHGKSFATLMRGAPPGVVVAAFDVFADQASNYDKSGQGDRSIFDANMQREFALAPEKLRQMRVRQADSTKMRPADILNVTLGQPLMFFSVDGCHTYACTMSDLRLALAVLHPRGIISVDDYYNPSWPGVASAAVAFLVTHAREAVAIAYGENKLYIVHASAVSFWTAGLKDVCRGRAGRRRYAYCRYRPGTAVHEGAGLMQLQTRMATFEQAFNGER